jgi:membrane protease YdiL (CAAX protease family)
VNRTGDAIALVVVSLSLTLMTRTAAASPQHWPWIWTTLAFALLFLLLLVPSVRRAGARLAMQREAAAWVLPAVAAAAALASALLYNATIEPPQRLIESWRLAAVPIVVALGVAAAGRGAAEPGGWRLLGAALAFGLVAGLWDRALKLAVPGNTPIGLAFFLAVALGIYVFTAVRPLRSLGLDLALPVRDLGTALAGFAAVVLIAIPLGFATGFVVWNPRLDDAGFAAARFLGLVVFVGIPEEILFRGLIQEGIGRLRTARVGWIAASVIFGLSHITKGTGLTPEQHAETVLGMTLNWRYALLATIAGLGYGWVYRRTGKVSAAALTHGAVNWVWSGFFGR